MPALDLAFESATRSSSHTSGPFPQAPAPRLEFQLVGEYKRPARPHPRDGVPPNSGECFAPSYSRGATRLALRLDAVHRHLEQGELRTQVFLSRIRKSVDCVADLVAFIPSPGSEERSGNRSGLSFPTLDVITDFVGAAGRPRGFRPLRDAMGAGFNGDAIAIGTAAANCFSCRLPRTAWLR